MEIYTSFKNIHGIGLKVTRIGFFRPFYVLGDDLYSYGDVHFTGGFKKISVLTTAEGSWTIARESFFSRVMLIYDDKGENIGSVTPEVWNRKTKLVMNNGFEANFYNKKILSRTNTWESSQYGEILSIQIPMWAYKVPFKVIIQPNASQTIPEFPLLALLGINLALLKQAQAQAAH